MAGWVEREEGFVAAPLIAKDKSAMNGARGGGRLEQRRDAGVSPLRRAIVPHGSGRDDVFFEKRG